MKIYFHRDFDGMAAAAILADALATTRGHHDVSWEGVNFDRTLEWDNFASGEEFAVVDFHYHPRAKYWFDHHPTTFLDDSHQEQYSDDENRCFDPTAKSCPPIILRHAAEHWGYTPPAHFTELAKWSDISTPPDINLQRLLCLAPSQQ